MAEQEQWLILEIDRKSYWSSMYVFWILVFGESVYDFPDVLFAYFSSMKSHSKKISHLKCHETKPLGVPLKLRVHRDCLPQSIQHWPISSFCSSSLEGLRNSVCVCVLYRTLFYIELYFTYIFIFLYCCMCVFQVSGKEMPHRACFPVK